MKDMDKFISYLTGKFDNNEQIESEEKNGNIVHPKSKHSAYVFNDKIENLPNDFKDYFIIEEGYYEMGEMKQDIHHIFKLSKKENGNLILESYEISNLDDNELKNYNNINIKFEDLKESHKFTPIEYIFKDNAFEGISISNLPDDVTLEIKQRVEKDALMVSEILRKDGKITFGLEEPIIYKRIK